MYSRSLQYETKIVGAMATGILLLFLLPLILPAVQAQDDPSELPPFPILYGGRALVDGEPLPVGTRLTARVGDYEAVTVVEEDGYYRNLLLAPPKGEYYGQPVTFHALNLTAAEEDIFKETVAPVFKDVGFDIEFTREARDETPTLRAWVVGIGVLMLLTAIVALFVAGKLRAA